MGKQLDPNHLALMTAAANTRDELRTIIVALELYEVSGLTGHGVETLRTELGRVCDRLRLVLKGRIQ